VPFRSKCTVDVRMKGMEESLLDGVFVG
jgi:hypothetical protein